MAATSQKEAEARAATTRDRLLLAESMTSMSESESAHEKSSLGQEIALLSMSLRSAYSSVLAQTH
jgi:hypothetical protein